jgi:TonB family protein
LQEEIDLVVLAEQEPGPGGISYPVAVSFVLHAAFILWFIFGPARSAAPSARNVPIARYVELMQQNPREFVEAPGPKVDRAPMNAAYSDANRKASTPEPSGLTPTKRPGDGSGLYTPPMGGSRSAQAARQPQAPEPQQDPQFATESPVTPSQQHATTTDTFVYRERQETTKASAAAAAVDWRNAIREVKGPVGGGEGIDPSRAPGGGGDTGLAEQGPLSFETQWYDWGPYAQSMVSRIRVNWYANMPQLIRTGISGVVTIRFTIQRDGRLTEVTVLKSSGHPPYDFAARKAIELSSPLNPLPADFPNANEHVTAMFYYNQRMPG